MKALDSFSNDSNHSLALKDITVFVTLLDIFLRNCSSLFNFSF